MWIPGGSKGKGGGPSVDHFVFEEPDVEGQDLQVAPRSRSARPAWRPLAAVAGFAALAAGCLLLAGHHGRRAPEWAGLKGVEELAAFGPTAAANANDLWGIHDLLLMGYRAPFMAVGSQGLMEIQAAVGDLVILLPKIHPYAPCRQRLAAVVAGTPEGKERVVQAAQAAWECLPAQFTPASFDVAFTADGLDVNPNLVGTARDPKVLDPSVLGACATTHWHRTCSFWVSLHAMAYRADALQMGPRFLRDALTVLAGGATMCGGCTLHLRALHKPVLSANVQRDMGPID